jgi:hypothetical protein
MLVSPELPEHWKRLDEFEGADYARILVPVEDGGGTLIAVANIYALATKGKGGSCLPLAPPRS